MCVCVGGGGGGGGEDDSCFISVTKLHSYSSAALPVDVSRPVGASSLSSR